MADHDIFFVMDAAERMSILHHDREVCKEKMPSKWYVT